MPQVLRTPEAQQDLTGIVGEIAHDKPSAAVRWLQDIEHVFHLLSTQPLCGERFRRRRSGEVRRHCFGNYVIYYRPLPDGIEVYRVFHGARDHERLV
jgi:toxin ParE1/3/4